MLKRQIIALLAGTLFSMPVMAGPVRLVTGDDLPPYTGQKLPAYGMLTEIVQRAFDLAGMETSLHWAPWKRGYEMTKIGEYDATFPYAHKPEREKDYLYSDLVYGGVRAVYARPGSGIDPERIDTFHGKTYCVPHGFIVYPQIEELHRRQLITIQRPFSLASCARMMVLGRVDFFITDALGGDETLKQANVGTAVVRLEKPFDRAEFHLIVPKSRPGAQALVDNFNAGLRRLKASGEYAAIVRKHLQ
jgi:polar amino acid transport system substrate-binding protein